MTIYPRSLLRIVRVGAVAASTAMYALTAGAASDTAAPLQDALTQPTALGLASSGMQQAVVVLLVLLLLGALGAAAWLLRELRRARRAALTARDSERLRYGRALEGARDGLAIWGPDGRLLSWNKGFEEIANRLGRAPRLDQTFDVFVTGATEVVDIADAVARSVAAGAAQAVVLPGDVVIEIAHRHDADGDAVTTLRDVSAERAAQRRVAEGEARFRDGIECMAEGFMLWDRLDRLVAWNRRAETLLPVQAPLFRVGLPFEEVLAHLARFNGGHARRETWLAELEMRRNRRARLGQVSTFRSSLERLVESIDHATTDGGIVSTYRDVTEQHRLLDQLHAGEAELRRALTAEREMNEQQRRFVAMASHEFRTPLAIIDGAAQRLLAVATTIAPDAGKRLARIRAAVSRMTEIIDRTLATARLDEGRIEMKRERCDIVQLALDVIRRQQTITPDYTIALAASAEAAFLDGDVTLLDHILTNLLSNAVKYSQPATRIELRIDPTPDEIILGIADRGIGIPADEFGQLFSRFFRSRLVAGIAGTGMGLYLVREFIVMHGGSIDVRSEVGHGTTFTVRLPRRAAIASAA